MRKFPLLLTMMTVASAAPAAAADDKLGKRTGEPEQLLAGIGEGTSDAELERQVAAAAGHPLGSLQNPIRVGGPEGERSYIARLRCSDGSAPKVGPRADGGVGAYGSVVGLYPLDCGRAAPGRVNLVTDMYHEEHAEPRAPAGFSLHVR